MAVREHALFRRVDHPSADVAKGGCYYSYDTGPGVDTGILIDFEGTLFFSLNTIKELAEVAGFSIDGEALEHERQLAEQSRLIEQLEGEKSDLLKQLDAVGLAVAHAAHVEAEPAKAKRPSTKSS